MGVAGAAVNIVILIYYIVFPSLGVYNKLSLGVIIGIYVFWLIYYFVRRAYMRSKGIDIELAFQQIPPD